MEKLSKEEIKALENADVYTKSGYFYKFDSGEIIEFDKPGIRNEIWYDDEHEGPIKRDKSNKKEVFLHYNMRSVRNAAREWLDNDGCGFLSEPLLCKEWDYEKTGRCYIVWRGWPYPCGKPDPRDLDKAVRTITRHEIEEVAEAYDETVKAFKKRLETYYKRYSEKIWQRGYWRNR